MLTTPAAEDGFNAVPLPIQRRIATIYAPLADWPAVSGAKPLRGDLQGSFRIRTGEYRVVFRTETDPESGEVTVTVWKIGYRGDVYD